MTHHTAKANLEKGPSWPSEAIPYGVPLNIGFWYPYGQDPHLGPDLGGPILETLRDHPIIS